MSLNFILIFLASALFHPSFSLSPVLPKDVTQPLEILLDQAVAQYHAKHWPQSVSLFEKALVNYKMSQHAAVACIGRCKVANISKEIEEDLKEFPLLKAAGDLVAQASCIKICSEEHPFGSLSTQVLRKDIARDVEARKPYNYLQFAYHKMNLIKKACQAAFTYYQIHTDKEDAKANLEFYRSLPGVKPSYFTDLEADTSYQLFVEGAAAYEEKKYGVVVDKIEKCLISFFKAVSDCDSLCYKPVEMITFHKFTKAITEQYYRQISCALKCEDKLSPVVHGQKQQNFVAQCFSYLQFAYYSLGKYEMAVPAAATVLLLDPEHSNAKSNLDFYESKAEEYKLIPSIHFHPRADGVKFHAHKLKNLKFVEDAQMMFGDLEEEELPENEAETENEDTNKHDEFVDEITEQVAVAINSRLRGEEDI